MRFGASARRALRACVGSACLAALPLAAQTSPSEPPKSIEVAFHLMQVGRAAASGLHYPSGPGVIAPLELKPHERTGPYRYRGPNPIVFFRERPGPEGKPVREPVGSLHLMTDLKQALVFAIPRAPGPAAGDPALAGQAEVAFAAIDDSRGAFGPDTLVIYNSLPMRVGAVLGGQRFVVEPGAHPPIPVKEWQGRTVPIEFWVETSDGPRLVLGGDIDFRPDNREVMILLPPRRAGSWLIQSVRIGESMNTPPPAPARGR